MNETLYWLAGACLAVIALVQIVKESRITAAENAERGRRRVAQEDIDIHNATEWMKARPVCPDCKTDDGRRRDREGRRYPHAGLYRRQLRLL